jgi:hypothetical protein
VSAPKERDEQADLFGICLTGDPEETVRVPPRPEQRERPVPPPPPVRK